MALPPKFAGQRLAFAPPAQPATAGVPAATHTLEVYVDYCCPFSAKIMRALQDVVFPMVRASADGWAPRLTVILRQQVQPWHPSSTLMHEAGLAVLRLAPARFWDFSRLLFDAQAEYFDVSVVNEVRNDTYRRLAKLAAKAGVDEAAVYGLLEVPDKPSEDGSLNIGNKVTRDLALMTRMSRLTGVHVTPTVLFNGVVQGIESSWTGDQWKEWLTNNVV